MAGKRDIIVIGGSAGSGAALKTVLAGLPRNLPAAVFVSTHIPQHGPMMLAEMLASASALPVAVAVDGQAVEHGRITVAAPNHHLLLIDGVVRLGTGPRENMSRPSIDPLFRSAAFTYRERVVGVILTGMLNDGASGLHAVKQCGGTAIVQHPSDAASPDMPRAALESTDVDHVVKAADLSELLVRLTDQQPPAPTTACPAELDLEILIAAGRHLGGDQLKVLADPSVITCPDCHGVLSEMNGAGPLRFRCQIGHAYTAEAVLAAGEDGVDEAMRIALRIMEERHALVSRMAADARRQGRTAMAELYGARAQEYGGHAASLRAAATLSLRLARSAA